MDRDQSSLQCRGVSLRIAGGLAIAMVLAACAVMDTGPTRAPDMPLAASRCESTLGSYALPKTLLRGEVLGTEPDPAKAQTALTALNEISIADSNRIYCLDHLSSPTARDTISVVRGSLAYKEAPPREPRTSTNLLTFVSSSSIDYTADIVTKIIRAIFIGISGKPDFAPVARSLRISDKDKLKYTLADLTFDPFDIFDVIRTNQAMRPLGFCVLLEIDALDTIALEGPRFCGDGRHLRKKRELFEAAYAQYERAIDLPTRVPGILYRPRQSFRAFVFAKDDPKRPEGWRLVQIVHLRLENISPGISVGLERALFATRRTALLFDRGALRGWCVSKQSELLAAMNIPLEVVRSIVALPTAILQVRIDEVTKSEQLVAAEKSLIVTQQQYIKYLLDPKQALPSSTMTQKGVSTIDTGAPDFPADIKSVLATTAEETAARERPDFYTIDAEFGKVCSLPSTSAGTASTADSRI